MALNSIFGFFHSEFDQKVKKILIMEIDKFKDTNVIRELTFNVFDVTLNFSEKYVLIESVVIDPIAENGYKISLSEFEKLLRE